MFLEENRTHDHAHHHPDFAGRRDVGKGRHRHGAEYEDVAARRPHRHDPEGAAAHGVLPDGADLFAPVLHGEHEGRHHDRAHDDRGEIKARRRESRVALHGPGVAEGVACDADARKQPPEDPRVHAGEIRPLVGTKREEDDARQNGEDPAPTREARGVTQNDDRREHRDEGPRAARRRIDDRVVGLLVADLQNECVDDVDRSGNEDHEPPRGSDARERLRVPQEKERNRNDGGKQVDEPPDRSAAVRFFQVIVPRRVTARGGKYEQQSEKRHGGLLRVDSTTIRSALEASVKFSKTQAQAEKQPSAARRLASEV